jgi:hypothetical protein
MPRHSGDLSLAEIVGTAAGIRCHTFATGATPLLPAVVVLSAVFLACASPRPGAVAPVTASPITIDAAPVPLNPENLSVTTLGDFQYAGGLELASTQTDRLHGLSDLIVSGSGRLTAIGDEGILFEAQLVFDHARQLVGITDGRLTLLTGEDGLPLVDKEVADAEGLTQLPGGDRLVSFERRDRIWLYPAAGGPPRPVAAPQVVFPLNAGMEALALDPESGPDAYVVGAEDSGEMWNCRVGASQCIKRPDVEKPGEFGLVAINSLPGMRTVQLLRAYDAVRGNRIVLRILSGGTEVARMDIQPPMTVDNFEGLATIPGPDAGIRFYLISDDNDSASQRTLLLAFDWQPR